MDTTRANMMFHAFADETRLRILHLLRDEEVCVGDLVAILGLPQPTVSRQLANLRRAGLVATRREGLWRFYRLAEPDSPLHDRLVECLQTCFLDVPTLEEDERHARAVRASGGCCPRPGSTSA